MAVTRKKTVKKKLPKAPKNGKIEKVMGEFKRGTLKTSAGKKVTSLAQAKAIAINEARRKKKPDQEEAARLDNQGLVFAQFHRSA